MSVVVHQHGDVLQGLNVRYGGRVGQQIMEWSVKRIEEVVRQLVPSCSRVEVTFPSDGVLRVVVVATNAWGVQGRVQSVLTQALPSSIQRVEVLVVRGSRSPLP